MTPVSSNGGPKVMVSNLPLLFARGSPTSLESMCLEELQLFLKFVLKCEQNVAAIDIDTLRQPPWWPKGAEWGSKILNKKEQRGKTSNFLRSAIKCCYTYYDCMYLLEFCRKLISFTGGIENLQVVDNRDGTRSLLNRSSKKLLVTFKAENQDYDKDHFTHQGMSKTSKGQPQLGNVFKKPCFLKQLVTSKSDNSSDPNLTKFQELYLCDTCDKDFDSLKDLEAHERVCGDVSSQSSFDAFLSGLKLHRVGRAVTKRETKARERPRAANYDRFMSIDLASPLGRYIVNLSKLTLDQISPATRGYKSLDEYNAELDARCPGTIKSLKNSNAFMDIRGKWKSSYRCYRRNAGLWSHTYCFTSSQVETKMRVMKAGLSSWSMRHYRRCQRNQCSVKLARLQKESIEEILKKEKAAAGVPRPVKNTARKSFSGSERTVVVRSKEEDKAIDELLEDSSDESETNTKAAAVLEPNKIVSFASGFATWTEKHDEDMIQIKKDPDRGVTVPKPLPELQKIYINNSPNQAKSVPNREIECVDLCSSDEDS